MLTAREAVVAAFEDSESTTLTRKQIVAHAKANPKFKGSTNTIAQFLFRDKDKTVRRVAKGLYSLVGEETVSREEMLEQELRDLRSSERRDRSREVLDERLLERITTLTTALKPVYSPAKRKARAAGNGKAHRFALLWSDLHAAEVVDSEAIGGLNAFDWDIMLRRHDRLSDSIFSFRDHRNYEVEGLHMFALGDMVTGDIHDELRITNEVALTEAVIQLGLDMAKWIETLVPEFPWIQIDAVHGNHGRRSKKPQFKQSYDNWDWLFYKILEANLARYESVTVNAPRSATTPVQVFDRTVLLWHGDGVPTNMPGVPWGGITRRTKELLQTHSALGRRIDHFAVGHYHEPNTVANRLILMNGSVKGPDEYSLARFGGGAPAAQVLHTFHPARGLTDTSYIDLSDVQ